MTLQTLRVYTIGYLLLPNVLFLSSWVRSAYAIPCLVLLLGLSVWVIQGERRHHEDSIFPNPLRTIALAGLASVMLSAVCGVGGYTCQTPDYWMHNAKFSDLVQHEWPLRFPTTGSYACYYFGYYLPVAALAKWIGNAQLLSLLWASTGMALLLLWLYALPGFRSWGWVGLVLLFGTPFNLLSLIRLIDDYVSGGVFNGFMLNTTMLFSSKILQIYFPFIRSLLWLPNQLIPACLATVFLLHETTVARRFLGSVLVAALLLYWAPFPAMTLAALAATTWMLRADFWQWLRRPRSLLFIGLTALSILPVILYFLCSAGTGVSGFLWQFDRPWWLYYGLTLIGEAGVFYWLINRLHPTSPWRLYLLISALTLCLLPLYRLGVYNDLHGRGAIPPLMVLSVAFVSALRQAKRPATPGWLRYGSYALYLTGAVVPLLFLALGVINGRWRTNCHPIADPRLTDLYQVLYVKGSPPEARQYECREGCFFIENVVKK